VDVPLSSQELEQKFVDCSTGLLSAKRQAAALHLLRRLEALTDISELVAQLREKSRAAAG
jgi:hypothetical protein